MICPLTPIPLRHLCLCHRPALSWRRCGTRDLLRVLLCESKPQAAPWAGDYPDWDLLCNFYSILQDCSSVLKAHCLCLPCQQAVFPCPHTTSFAGAADSETFIISGQKTFKVSRRGGMHSQLSSKFAFLRKNIGFQKRPLQSPCI